MESLRVPHILVPEGMARCDSRHRLATVAITRMNRDHGEGRFRCVRLGKSRCPRVEAHHACVALPRASPQFHVERNREETPSPRRELPYQCTEDQQGGTIGAS